MADDEKPTFFIECRGCWRIVALGFSTRERRIVHVDKSGEVKGISYAPLPVHDTEVCPDCGREYNFPSLDAEPEPAPPDDAVGVIFRFGPFAWEEKAPENFLCSLNPNYERSLSPW